MKTAADLKHGRAGGFTRTDLAATLAAMTLLAFGFGNSMGKPKAASQSAVCVNNLQQVIRAWQMYANENNDRFPGFNTLTGGNAANSPLGFWAVGAMTWDNRTDNTNALYLTDSRYSSLAGYLGHRKEVFKCPSDTFLSAAQRKLGWKERGRSVSSSVLLGVGDTAWDLPPYKQAKRFGDLTVPSPSETFVFLDEAPDSINDCAFFPPTNGNYSDLPAGYHEGGCGFAFADGRAENHAWKTPELLRPVRYVFTTPAVKPGSADMAWLQYHSPRLKE